MLIRGRRKRRGMEEEDKREVGRRTCVGEEVEEGGEAWTLSKYIRDI